MTLFWIIIASGIGGFFVGWVCCSIKRAVDVMVRWDEADQP